MKMYHERKVKSIRSETEKERPVASAHHKKYKKDKNEKDDRREPDTRDAWQPEIPRDEPGKDGCDIIYDDVWEEKCKTVYNDTKCWDSKDR